ncbi:MAG: hypothetical protein AAF170_12075 [Bacteroidota bacterium]
MIRVPVALDRTFSLPADIADTFGLLSDIPAWGALYPRVAAIEPLPEHGAYAWRWRMEPMGPPGFEARTVYGCTYAFDIQNHTVTWTPIESVGNALFSGSVELAEAVSSTVGTLHLEADMEIPAPRFVRRIVQAQVSFEMGRMTDRFLEHVRDALA